MNNTKNRLCTLAALLLGVLVLAAPKAAAQGFAAGTALCLQSVLPALFPFFVVCELLTAAAPPAALLRPMQRVLGLASPDTAQAVLLSWVGGYAVCARLAGQLYSGERIPRQDAVRLQILGCCSGPGFVIGCVGGLLLGNVRLGVVMYTAQLAANLGAAALLRLAGADASPPPAGPAQRPAQRAIAAPDGTTLPGAISAAVTSSLSVCGCVVFFRLAGAVLCRVLPLPAAVVSAVLEISAGCADIAALGGQAALYGCCGALSLLGMSVWAQIQLFAGAAFCPRVLFVSRCLHFVLLQIAVRLCVRALPGAAAVCSTLSARAVPLWRMPPDAAVWGVIFLAAALYKLRQSLYNE